MKLGELEREQRQAWMRGQQVPVESYLGRYPALGNDSEVLLDLIYQEFCLRVEMGGRPDPQEYQRRFPDLTEELGRLFEVHAVVGANDSAGLETMPLNTQGTKTLTCPGCGAALHANGTDAQLACAACGQRLSLIDPAVWQEAQAQQKLGSFELVRRLGRGHYGEVWLARDAKLERDVAIKVPRHLGGEEKTNELFLREGRALARLRHANIVPVYDVGFDGDFVFIVSAYIQGTELRQLLQQKRFSPLEAAQLSLSLAEALQHAHQMGVVHRDVKPSNVLIDAEGTPYLTDFGLAKYQASDELTISSDGELLGTPAYMPPEQARGESEKIGPASDIYSLGVVLYELLTGKRPFDGRVELLLNRILMEDPVPPRRIDAHVPRDLETICLKAMAKSPTERYSTAQAFAEDLQRFLRGESILARRAGALERSLRWSRRNALKIALATTAAGFTGLAGAQYFRSPESQPGGQHRIRLRLEALVEGTEVPQHGRVAFVPWGANTGHLMPELMIQADAAPDVDVALPPGNYLVVAEVPGLGFHEVWRHVPAEEKKIPGTFAHQRWKYVDGLVELPSIHVHEFSTSPAKMALFEGAERFSMGLEGAIDVPRHTRSVSPFFLDFSEVTVGEYRRHRNSIPIMLRKSPPPDDHAITCVSWDEAIYFAELLGKRLPEEAEYEFAATNGGETRYPWGNEAPSNVEWTYGAADACPFDRLLKNPEVRGLCSNVAEWTLSPFSPHLGPDAEGGARPASPEPHFIIRGGSSNVVSGKPETNEWERLPFSRKTRMAPVGGTGLGFRCAKSTKPRFLPEDFGRIF
jgi:predicted Ser/Thr protein kinase